MSSTGGQELKPLLQRNRQNWAHDHPWRSLSLPRWLDEMEAVCARPLRRCALPAQLCLLGSQPVPAPETRANCPPPARSSWHRPQGPRRWSSSLSVGRLLEPRVAQHHNPVPPRPLSAFARTLHAAPQGLSIALPRSPSCATPLLPSSAEHFRSSPAHCVAHALRRARSW